MSAQKCPQFAVNPQLATRNPQRAVYCPLKVGSEPNPKNRGSGFLPCRRPLKVGSGRGWLIITVLRLELSPSPQGRVGTPTLARVQFATNSRRPLKVGSGRGCFLATSLLFSCRRPLKVGSGQEALVTMDELLAAVAVPSRSGRDLSIKFLRATQLGSRRRPLKVGSGPLPRRTES